MFVRRNFRCGPGYLPVLLPLALLLGITIFQTTGNADSVTLSGGQVIIDSTLRVIRVDLVGGGGLNIHSVVDLPAPIPPGKNYISSTIGCGCDGFGRLS